MSSSNPTLYYYLNEETKQVVHYTEQQQPTPDGCVFCGMSELPVRGAAGYYTKNQSGYTIVYGDESAKENKNGVQEEEIQT